MGQSAREKEPVRTPGMHAGRRFGDVLVSPRTDAELTWYFNDSEEESRPQSWIAYLGTRRMLGSLEVAEENAEATDASERAVIAYERVRGDGPSVVPPEVR
jgi:hypothetical protein